MSRQMSSGFSDLDTKFSTRTRLRPGGPSSLSSGVKSRDRLQSSNLISNHNFIATLRNGSLPSVTMSEFEEIGMRTMHHGLDRGAANNFCNDGSTFADGRLNGYYLQNMGDQKYHQQLATRNRAAGAWRGPATPLVKLRINAKSTDHGGDSSCLSPRVQMYRTRVVYSDKDPNATAGVSVVTSGAGPNGGPLNIMSAKSNFAVNCRRAPEAAV